MQASDENQRARPEPVQIDKRDNSDFVQKPDQNLSVPTNNASQKFVSDEPDSNWFEIRISGKQPERRAYHSSFVHKNQMYVYGGNDIGQGLVNTLWSINLNQEKKFLQHLESFDLDDEENNGQSQGNMSEWRCHETFGNVKPRPISHHTSIVYNDIMYLYGGSFSLENNQQFYTLDLDTFKWDIIELKGLDDKEENIPNPRDEHTAILCDDCMIVFGGFDEGQRTNDIFKYHFQQQVWERLQVQSEEQPCPRAGHSATLYYSEQAEQSMLVFGGKDDENGKLSDLWQYHFSTNKWEKLASTDPEPTARSGHSTEVYRDFLIVFGGIYMLTQELNDTYLYDLKTRNWICLFDEEGGANNGRSPSVTAKAHMLSGGMSPTKRKTMDHRERSMLKDRMDQESLDNVESSVSPKKIREKELRGTRKTIAVLGSYPQKPPKTVRQNTHQEKNLDESQHELSSPTSITMRNTFIIKNADSSFDNYYHMMKMKKRQSLVNGNSTGSNFGHSPVKPKSSQGLQQNKRPAARDGHTSVLHNEKFYVFGGDRHHMPFNDMFVLDVKNEFIKQNDILY